MTKLNKNDLKKFFGLILEKLDSVEEVQLCESDMYWYVSASECYDITQQPSNILVGSLADDLEELMKLTKDNSRVVTFVDFDRLASVLHAISEGMNPQ